MLGLNSLKDLVVHEFYSSLELADVDSLHNEIHLAALTLQVALDHLIALRPFLPLVFYLVVLSLNLLAELLLALDEFAAIHSTSLGGAIFAFL